MSTARISTCLRSVTSPVRQRIPSGSFTFTILDGPSRPSPAFVSPSSPVQSTRSIKRAALGSLGLQPPQSIGSHTSRSASWNKQATRLLSETTRSRAVSAGNDDFTAFISSGRTVTPATFSPTLAAIARLQPITDPECEVIKASVNNLLVEPRAETPVQAKLNPPIWCSSRTAQKTAAIAGHLTIPSLTFDEISCTGSSTSSEISPTARHRRAPAQPLNLQLDISPSSSSFKLNTDFPKDLGIMPEMISISTERQNTVLHVVADAWHKEKDAHYEWKVELPKSGNMSANLVMNQAKASVDEAGHLSIVLPRM